MIIRFFGAALLAAFSLSAFAYPEAYPRFGESFDIGDGNTQYGHFRYAKRDQPGTEDDEYLFAWWTGNVVRAVIVDGNTFEPRIEPIELVDISPTNTVPNPFTQYSTFLGVSDFDITWNPVEERYFLIVKMRNEIDRPDDPPTQNSYILGSYIDLDGPVDIEEWSLVATSDLHNQVRAIHGPHEGDIHLFWHHETVLPSPETQLRGKVLGQRITGTDEDGKLVFAHDEPVVLMKAENKPSTQDFRLDDMVIELDPENEQFLLAATHAVWDGDDYYTPYTYRSDIYARVVLPGPRLPNGETPDRYTTLVDGQHEYRQGEDFHSPINWHKFSGNWTVFHPQLTLGPIENDGDREWLIAFKAVHDIENPTNDELASGTSPGAKAMHSSWLARRISVNADHDVVVKDTEDQRIGGTEEKSSAPQTRFRAHGMWSPIVNRYLFPWIERQFGSVLLASIGQLDGPEGGAISNERIFATEDMLNGSISTGTDRFSVHVLPAVDTKSDNYFVVGQDKNRLLIQPIEMRWLDYSLSAREIDAPGEALPLGESRHVEITLDRKRLDELADVIGDFESGKVSIRVRPGTGISVESDDFVDGDEDTGYRIAASDMLAGDRHIYSLRITNSNPYITSIESPLRIELEMDSRRVDAVASNDSESLAVVLQANPDGVEDPNHDPGNGDPNDGPDHEDPDNGDPDNNDPDNGDSDTKKGGGATGLLLLFGLGITGWRRRRNK